jgi:hypothetical protein
MIQKQLNLKFTIRFSFNKIYVLLNYKNTKRDECFNIEQDSFYREFLQCNNVLIFVLAIKNGNWGAK